MHISDFELERYFARWEFTAPYLLCSSDVEGYRMQDLLALADNECRALWQNLTLGYTETAGHPLLRTEIASLYKDSDSADTLTCAGAEEAIFMLMNVLLRAGDHAIVTWPGYQSLYSIAHAIQADVTLLPLAASNGWELDLANLRRALRSNTRLIVINFPHNPTGALPSQALFMELLDIAREANVYLLSDEVYRGLEYDQTDQLPAVYEAYSKGISLGAMAKIFALAGLRIGWLACHDRDVLRQVAAFKDYLSICNSAPSEILSLIALRAREQIVARNRAIIAKNLVSLDNFFARWSAVFEWLRPHAGSIAFPRLLANLPIEQFATELVEKEGVLILPGTVYDHPGNHFRIGLGRTNLPEALEHLEHFMAQRF